ncbi:hypothetical protein OEZ71_12990 [Defluviimonas sp. WL0050]|uniref:Uncharacterized protein n=1 Tax=Albidovulum litorale TaxID=2984134 RepID=A0ABT2ZR35_9RHOB|nr:hypothetical protein [Defluviimonas sp. WL0050]MCV2873211.1 hypothetical protein [Defluviimonas sp. WL0050]
MDWLIWIGAVVTLAGLALLVWVIFGINRARKAGLPDADLRAKLQKAVALNLGAMLLSGLGLMMVVLGIVLG